MDRRIQSVITLMEARLATPQDTKSIARLINLSPSRLRHLFKKETGLTPVQYLRDLKIREAELLLRTTFLTMKEISNAVGLRSARSFVREFRKVYGCAPTEYRERVLRGR
jgi:transcriptional regulator GlxA family with amidase domain